MIGITGVTGKLGSYVADLIDKKGIASIHLARSPERAKVYASAEIRKMVYANTPEVVEALKGIDILLMVSARENRDRVKEHEFLHFQVQDQSRNPSKNYLSKKYR